MSTLRAPRRSAGCPARGRSWRQQDQPDDCQRLHSGGSRHHPDGGTGPAAVADPAGHRQGTAVSWPPGGTGWRPLG